MEFHYRLFYRCGIVCIFIIQLHFRSDCYLDLEIEWNTLRGIQNFTVRAYQRSTQ